MINAEKGRKQSGQQPDPFGGIQRVWAKRSRPLVGNGRAALRVPASTFPLCSLSFSGGPHTEGCKLTGPKYPPLKRASFMVWTKRHLEPGCFNETTMLIKWLVGPFIVCLHFKTSRVYVKNQSDKKHRRPAGVTMASRNAWPSRRGRRAPVGMWPQREQVPLPHLALASACASFLML